MISRIIVLALALTSAAATRALRRAAPTTPDDLVITAEAIARMQSDDQDTLYNVAMTYDKQYGGSDAGDSLAWSPPYVMMWDVDFWKSYIDDDSCLGTAGPLGEMGPLGDQGPLSFSSSAVTNWLNMITGGWVDALMSAASFWWGLDSSTDPYGPSGPLGEKGPLAPDQIYGSMYQLNRLYGANDFTANLDVTGVWSALGPLGPLGALGPLGPLGPKGLFGATAMSSDGSYHDKSGNVVRTVRVKYDTSGRTYRVYRLFEVYTQEAALALGTDNDASFGVVGTLHHGQQLCFPFTSRMRQWVTAVAVPRGASIGAGVDLDVQVRRRDTGAVAASAQASGLIDTVAFRAAAGGVYEACVQAHRKTAGGYRLYVTGTGFLEGAQNGETPADVFNHFNIKGPHQSTVPGMSS